LRDRGDGGGRKRHYAVVRDQGPHNHGRHIIRMPWGKVLDIDANEDSELFAACLQTWAAHGVNEALADPILS